MIKVQSKNIKRTKDTRFEPYASLGTCKSWLSQMLDNLNVYSSSSALRLALACPYHTLSWRFYDGYICVWSAWCTYLKLNEQKRKHMKLNQTQKNIYELDVGAYMNQWCHSKPSYIYGFISQLPMKPRRRKLIT